MPDVSYTGASDQDLPQIKSLIDAVKGDSNNLLSDQFILAKDGQKIIGCVRTIKIGSNYKGLASLAVLPEYRNQGVGAELVKRVISKDLSRPIYLICFAEREKFYNKNNFKVINPNDLPEILQEEYKRITSNYTDPKVGIIAMKLA